MKRKTTRLTFTEEELANPNIRRTAKKAARAVDRADKAKAKLSTRAYMILMGGVLALVILVIFSFVTSCSVFFPGGTGAPEASSGSTPRMTLSA